MLKLITSKMQSSEGERKDECEDIEQRVRQKMDCSQIEDSFEEGDVVEWYEDDEMRRRREEVSKEETRMCEEKQKEKVCRLRVCKRVPELLVSQTLTKEKELRKNERIGNVVGWSTEKMEEERNNQLVKDAEEMVRWRSINQEEIDEVWKKLAVKIEEEVLGKTKWKIAKEEPLEEEVSLRNGGWSRESGNISLENVVKIVGQEFSRVSRSITCSESKACMKVRQKRKR